MGHRTGDGNLWWNVSAKVFQRAGSKTHEVASGRAGKIAAGIWSCQDVGDVVAITCLAHRGRGAKDVDLGAVNLVLWKLLVYVVEGTYTCGLNRLPSSRWHDLVSGLYSLEVGRRSLWSLLLCSLRLSTCLPFWRGATRNGGFGACRYLDVGIVVKRLESWVGVLE